MLVLTRKPGEKVIIGEAITLTVVAVSGNQVRLGIDAPPPIRILRAELTDGRFDLKGTDKHLNPELAAAAIH